MDKQQLNLILRGLESGRIDVKYAEDEILALFSVTYCAKCGQQRDGYGIRGELCKECDHIMRLEAM